MSVITKDSGTVDVSSSLAAKEESGSQVSVNARLSIWLDRIVNDPNAPESLKDSCGKILDEKPRCIPATFVSRVAEFASQRREQGKTPKTKAAYTTEFLAGTKWFFAEGSPPPKRDYESETTVQRIRNDAANREYNRMTKNVNVLRSRDTLNFASDLKVANKEALAAFNCLLTVAGAFVFAYFATGYAIGDNLIAQVLVAILVSCVVAIADIYFLLKKLHGDETTTGTTSSGMPDSGLPKPSAFDLRVKSKTE